MIDGHVHLEKGPLTKEYVYKFLEMAQERNIDELQILDHTHRFVEFAPLYEPYRKCEDQNEWLDKCLKENVSVYSYIDLIKELKKEKLPINVKFGLEVCYQPGQEVLIKNLCGVYNWDFLVGSVHAVDYIMYDSSWSKEKLWNCNDKDYIYRKYYYNIIELIKSDLFTQLAHPDTIKMFNIYPTYDLTPTYQMIAKLLNEHHMMVENNVGCYYRYNHKDMGLSDELLKIFKDYKCKMITASDAHYPEHVGIHIDNIWDKTMS